MSLITLFVSLDFGQKKREKKKEKKKRKKHLPCQKMSVQGRPNCVKKVAF